MGTFRTLRIDIVDVRDGVLGNLVRECEDDIRMKDLLRVRISHRQRCQS